MAISLSGYENIESALIVKIQTGASSIYFPTTYLSDYYKPIEYDGDTYLPMGSLVSISDTINEINTSGYNLTVTLNPNVDDLVIDYLPGFLNYKIAGAEIQIRRMIFDPATGNALNIAGNPAGRFFGYINNFSIDEEYDIVGKRSSPIINLECSSYISVLQKGKSGRRTNHDDFVINLDYCMYRVSTLVNQPINFGEK